MMILWQGLFATQVTEQAWIARDLMGMGIQI